MKKYFVPLVLSLAMVVVLLVLDRSLDIRNMAAGNSENTVIPINSKNPVYSFAFNGWITLGDKNTSLIRFVLVDSKQNEYLIYETSSMLSDKSYFYITNACEETCFLSGVIPSHVRVEGEKFSYRLGRFSQVVNLRKLGVTLDASKILSKQEETRLEKEKDKIAKLGEYIKRNNLRWIAGETSVSKMSYAEKKKLFRQPDGNVVDSLPNLQGFEYYKGGIFELKTDSGDSSAGISGIGSSLPDSWDWRSVHGENWMTSVRNQGNCGSCWAFSATAAVETNLNLYYNQHANFDLAEQDLVSCSGVGNCGGGWPGRALEYIKNSGMCTENCFPYLGANYLRGCADRCSDNSDKQVKIGGTRTYGLRWASTSDDLKRMLIREGVISTGIPSWYHAMSLVGYYSNSDWKLENVCDGWTEFCRPGYGCVSKSCNEQDREMTLCVNIYRSFSDNNWPPSYGEMITYKCNYSNWNLGGSSKCGGADYGSQICHNEQCQQKSSFQLYPGFQDCRKSASFNNGFPIELWTYSPGQGESYWIFKNSWGQDWGENGYLRIILPVSEIGYVATAEGPFILPNDHSVWPEGFNDEISCADKDNDGYCNWGISSEKPMTCPTTCRSEKDCDDSNPNLGPFDENFNCVQLNPNPTISLTPTVTHTPIPLPTATDTLTPTPTITIRPTSTLLPSPIKTPTPVIPTPKVVRMVPVPGYARPGDRQIFYGENFGGVNAEDKYVAYSPLSYPQLPSVAADIIKWTEREIEVVVPDLDLSKYWRVRIGYRIGNNSVSSELIDLGYIKLTPQPPTPTSSGTMRINEIKPLTFTEGDNVIMKGEGFGENHLETFVAFACGNSVPRPLGQILSWHNNEIVFVVPKKPYDCLWEVFVGYKDSTTWHTSNWIRPGYWY